MVLQSELKELLNSTKAKDRIKASKEIGKAILTELSEELLLTFEKEIKSKKVSWNTQVEIIKALGIINCKKALPLINNIIDKNLEHDMITNASATCYVRLKRNSINDASPILDLLKKGGFSIQSGCLDALGYDKMIPTDEQICELIKLSWDIHLNKERGYADPRYGIASACAGWKPELTKEFLNHCLNTAGKDTPLIYVTENSLKGKYVKLR